jgi:hypothetical protein
MQYCDAQANQILLNGLTGQQAYGNCSPPDFERPGVVAG